MFSFSGLKTLNRVELGTAFSFSAEGAFSHVSVV